MRNGLHIILATLVTIGVGAPVESTAQTGRAAWRVARLPPVYVSQPAAHSLPPPVPQQYAPGTGAVMDIAPWWRDGVAAPLRAGAAPLEVDIETLLIRALRHSHRVRAISENALIRAESVLETEAEFDVHAFMETKMFRRDDPVGNVLETGGPPRLRSEDWRYVAGVRKKTLAGGALEASQRIGLEDNNSLFFDPRNQGNARLSLSYTQPLLNGYGQPYNTSLIVLATIDADVARVRTSRELQDHLLDVTRSYWQLYLQRSILLQKRRHLERAQAILAELEPRRGLDALDSQIARARSAVASRQAELARAAAGIRNAEAKLSALINDPQLLADGQPELVPVEPPLPDYIEIRQQTALTTAMQNRPEIDEALQQVEAARVRLEMSRHELLPVLDVILETYVRGLEGDFGIGQALTQQLSDGSPSYTAGFLFETPLYRRAANAKHRRRQLELRQVTHQLNATLDTLAAEVEVAVREVDTSHREMHGKYRAMLAAEADVAYLEHRWQLVPGEHGSAGFLLEDLLDAQDRLAAEEFGLAQAQVAYSRSLVELKRAMGTLLAEERISPLYTSGADCLPEIRFEKQAAAEVLPLPLP